MAEKILFIGAGASYGARPEDPPPMGDEFLRWLQKQLKSFKRQGHIEYSIINYLNLDCIEKIFRDNDNYFREKNYEKFIENVIEFGQSWDEINIQKFMAIALLIPDVFSIKNCFQKKIDLYGKLIETLKIESIFNVISLNYDILFEEAIGTSRFQYAEVDSEKIDNKDEQFINIFKPHGSINFHTDPISYGGVSQNITASEKQKLNSPKVHDYIISLPFRSYKDRGDLEKHILSAQNTYPVMAHYTKGKKPSWSLNKLQKIREESLNLLSKKNAFNEIIIIGVKPIFDSKDDPFVASFMNQLEKMELPDGSITYVGFDKEYRETNEDELIIAGSLRIKEKILQSENFSDCRKMKIKFGTKVKIYSDGLEGYIKEIRSEFSKDLQVSNRNQQPSKSPATVSPM